MSVRLSSVLFVVVACTGGAPAAPPRAAPPSPDAASVSPAPAPAPAAPASAPAPAVPGRLGCDLEVEIECPPGFDNGCAGGRTRYQACVPAGSRADVPCATPLALRCDPGQLDSCAAVPPWGDRHVCVHTR